MLKIIEIPMLKEFGLIIVPFGPCERLKPGCEAYIEEIEADIECKLEKVDWLPNFYSLPPHVQIANSKAYRQGMVRI